ncbi:dipeptidase [Mycetocola reblochoni]|uniref:Catalyzes the cleavage of p-aminobenzoyl-glutamate to p-aminobenzoate and glutamate, subunit A n=2 Tax=Mycetocola reblochoni TaxID=331618 RepID=A0A1R4J6C8_9MICO|nr:dipeptidase [Mycetocola reblochoni]RLP69609.1 dipeptidase [Mycetocola reblochoni]SJN27608.1 Catalyzes the cleavage of p-aminobenzoyl-glutamate to p-aminobenzoate and glutamate, subunit A [Mycetocola reblochoni REB411]
MNDVASNPEPFDSSVLGAAVRDEFPRIVNDLGDLVRIPSVAWSAFDPAEVQRSAEAVARLARDTGAFSMVDIRRAPVGDGDELGQPAVVARRDAAPGYPTVLLYAHHDVQPPGDRDHWDTEVYEPTLIDGRIYGRGAADDKAGVMAHIGAIRSLVSVFGDDLRVGIRLFIEGEEEFGSRSFAAFLEQNADDLEADAIVVADSGNWDEQTPGLTVALRGNVTFALTVRTLAHASHSGMFGGAVPDAMLAAVRTLDTMWDAEGAVAIDGLTRHEADTPDYASERLRDEAGLPEGVSEIGRGSVASRLWFQPSVTVTGINAPSVDQASNTLLPAVTVRVSVRVAPGQPAAEAYAHIRRHLEANAAFGAQLEFADVDLGDPFLVDTTGPAVAAITTAMTSAWGVEPVELGIGGSIPFIADLVQTFPSAEILVTGVEDPNSRAHSPNESLHVEGFRKSVTAEALFLAALRARGADASAADA